MNFVCVIANANKNTFFMDFYPMAILTETNMNIAYKQPMQTISEKQSYLKCHTQYGRYQC